MSAGGDYWLTAEKEDCPINLVITTETECIEASAQLGWEYDRLVKRKDRPAGCYTFKSEVRKVSKVSAFNSVTDPLLTSPVKDTVGICKPGSIR